MNPEQLQQYAKGKGWLSISNQFSWTYPWYRMHIVINLAGMMIDVGFNPVLLGGETCSWNGVNLFAIMQADVLQDVAVDIATIFATYIATKVTGCWNIALGIAAEGVKFLFQVVPLVYNSQGPGLIASAFCSFLMGLLAIKVDLAEAILNVLWHMLAGAANAVLQPRLCCPM